MQRALVTGGTGMLGRVLVPKLQAAGYTVRVMSRKPRPENFSDELEWAQADVLTGEGLNDSVRDVDVILHGATNASRDTNNVEVRGTRNMLQAARGANLSNFLYVSIVGIDRTPFPYYRAKLDAEKIVETFRGNVSSGGNVSHSILRATQFYELMDGILAGLARFPVAVIDPKLNFQPVDVREVSAKLVELVGQPPQGLLPDFAGPQILQLDEMMRTWLEAKHLRRAVLKVKFPGKFAAASRQGWNTNPQQRCGKITWAEWLAENYGRNGNGKRE